MSVKCENCYRNYEDVFSEETNQAFGCASEVQNNLVLGFFGSELIDMETYEFIERPNWINDGTICDKCIQYLFDKNLLKFSGNSET